MKLTKHDALAFLLMRVYFSDKDVKGFWGSEEEKQLLAKIMKAEKVDLSYEIAIQFREKVEKENGNYYDVAYKITRRCSRPWIVRVSGYLHLMAQASKSKEGATYNQEEYDECKKFDKHFNIDFEKEDPFKVTFDWLYK
jgi:hypothetical protein